MPRRRYLVEQVGIRWKIRVEEEEHGLYLTQGEAINAAIEAAHHDGPDEVDGTQVLVQRLKPTYRIVWTFSEDPFPPTDLDIAFRLAPSPRGTAGSDHSVRHTFSQPPRGAAG